MVSPITFHSSGLNYTLLYCKLELPSKFCLKCGVAWIFQLESLIPKSYFLLISVFISWQIKNILGKMIIAKSSWVCTGIIIIIFHYLMVIHCNP